MLDSFLSGIKWKTSDQRYERLEFQNKSGMDLNRILWIGVTLEKTVSRLLLLAKSSVKHGINDGVCEIRESGFGSAGRKKEEVRDETGDCHGIISVHVISFRVPVLGTFQTWSTHVEAYGIISRIDRIDGSFNPTVVSHT